ncbi:MAG: dihydroneopterin aldolase [Phocaeicola sp.]
MKTKGMYINLTGIKLYGYHGVDPQENRVGAYFYIDLRIRTDFSSGAQTDELAGTISYADIFDVVKEVMQKPCQLLEHVAYKMANQLFQTFEGMEEIEIKVIKENPPMGSECSQVGIEAHYMR